MYRTYRYVRLSAITERLCKTRVSVSQISQADEQLDKVLEIWRDRRLGEVVYLYLNAHYEKVRQAGSVKDASILIASGVKKDVKAILGVSMSLSDAETHWRSFLNELVQRGLQCVQLIVSDNNAILQSTCKAVFSGVPWKRYQFHLQQNAEQYVLKVGMCMEVTEDIRSIFNVPHRKTAETFLKKAVEKYALLASKLADWMEVNLPEGFTVFSLGRARQRKLRTSNYLKPFSQEIKRRTRVVRVLPKEQFCLRLISAILMETSEEWECGR